MIAPMSSEVKESIAALSSNKYFGAVRDWIDACGQANLKATTHPSVDGSEETFRNLGAYHAMNEMIEAIATAPKEYADSQ